VQGGEPGKTLVLFLVTKQEVQHKEIPRKANRSSELNQTLQKEGMWTEIFLP